MAQQQRKPTCVIELARPSKGFEGFSRERVKEFEKLCHTNPTMRKAFVGASGRVYYFSFPTITDTYEFLNDTQNMFTRVNVGWKRETYPAK